MKLKKLFSKLLWSIASGVLAVLVIGTSIGTWYAMNFGYAGLNMAFGTSNKKIVNDPDAEITVKFKSKYGDDVTAEKLLEEDTKIIEQVEAEGATLLWNKNSALPLAGTEKVSCLSHSSVDLVETGSGSGYINTVSLANPNTGHSVNLKDALTSRGLTVNDTLWNFYTSGAGRTYTRQSPKASCTEGQTWFVNEVPWNIYTDAVKSSFAQYGDAAIVVLSRSGGEYSDLHYSSTETKTESGGNGNYLALTSQEKELLENVQSYKNSGAFKKVVLLLNTANPLQFKDIQPYYDSIDSCLWIGQIGSAGANGVADLLVGNVTPSGHLTDTFAYDNESAPAAENDGDYKYDGNLSGLTETSSGGFNAQTKYMVYQEGIYVGYRYYETRYEDSILGNGNAASSKGAKMAETWNYSKEVAFPFGYGASYTSFSYSNFRVSENKDDYEVSVTVRNTGNTKGKEVVQVYLQKPYTSYDVNNYIEKASVELVGFAKTAELEKDKSENVTVTVPKEYFKTYDANNKKTYIVEQGDYYLTVGTNSHIAVNNILTAKGKTPEGLVVMGGETVSMTTDSNPVKLINVNKDDFTTYSKSAQTGYDITNQFDSGDWNKYANNNGSKITYLSRSDWDSTYPSTPTLTMNDNIKKELAHEFAYDEPDGATLPEYEKFASGSTDGTPDVSAGDVVAFQFMEAPLDPSKHTDVQDVIDGKVYSDYWADMWNQLLDQMTFEEQAWICAQAYHCLKGSSSINLPESKQENGPVGITKRTEAFFSLPNQRSNKSEAELKEMNDYQKSKLIDDYYWVAYPCAPVVAATYNVELIEDMGEHKSEDMLYAGYNGIYGPGVNIHRSPFGGRSFEYPSEDPFLAGTIEYFESVGIESQGCMAYAKHYALNDMETNRRHVGIWSNEQATREIYLRAFELTFAEGGAHATMNSFTRVGTRWCGASYAMMTTVLRDEWGFEGIVISDWDSGGAMSKLDGILAGTDSFDSSSGNAHSFDQWKNSPAVAQALRRSTQRIIWNVVRSNAMNGTSVTMKIVSVTPWWETAMYAVVGVTAGLFAISAGMLVASFILGYKWKKADEGASVETADSSTSPEAPESPEND